jgi:hypothetical protein
MPHDLPVYLFVPMIEMRIKYDIVFISPTLVYTPLSETVY